MNRPLPPETLYIPVDQVAARFSVSVDTVWRWCRKGSFPKPYHPGGSAARWKVAEVEEYEAALRSGLILDIDLSGSLFFDAALDAA
jgi:prophage regulatory protein